MSRATRPIMLGTAGHVDHGKTSLVKLMTGCSTDRLAEEKKRGLTIELGFAPCTMANDDILGIVDVPGHVSFIRNMVAGAHGIDVVMLVVAADDGVMPQTREHLDILTLMGLRGGLVAMTKVDRVSQERRKEVQAELAEFLEGTFLEGKPICEISSITGEGFSEFMGALNAEVAAANDSRGAGRFRVWCERAFTVKGFGTVATGIPHSGQVAPGDFLHTFPTGEKHRVRSMEVYGRPSTTARAGECSALNLADADAKTVGRGCLLSAVKPIPTHFFEASLKLLPSLQHVMKNHLDVHLHVGTAMVPAKVVWMAPGDFRPGQTKPVQLRLEKPLPVVLGERFIVRGQSGGQFTTLGGGRVCWNTGRKQKANQPALLGKLADMSAALDDPRELIGATIKHSDLPILPAALCDLLNLREDVLLDELAAGQSAGMLVELPDGRWIHTATLTAGAHAISSALDAFCAAAPDTEGLTEAEIFALVPKLDPAVAMLALSELESAATLKRTGQTLLPAGLAKKTESLEPELAELEVLLAATGVTPPRPDQIAETLSATEADIRSRLDRLVRRNLAVELDKNVFMHIDAIQLAKDVVLKLFAEKNFFETIAFRDALGVSRKYAVPLLDYLDTQKWTLRNANIRRPGTQAKEKLETL